jgi:hypothetical protein
MKLYRIKNNRTGKYYRHKYSQFRGGDWVDATNATIWTKPGGVNGAIGSLSEGRKKHPDFVIETATIDPEKIVWE